MSVYNFQQGTMAGAAGAGGYTIDQSIRFNDDDAAYLYRDVGSAPTDGKKFTYSLWIKRAAITGGTNTALLSGGSGTSTGRCDFLFTAGAATGDGSNFDSLKFDIFTGTFDQTRSLAKLRDPSSWYHIVFVFDAANATANDTMIMYLNGERLELDSTSGVPNVAALVNANGQRTRVGADASNTPVEFDGYMAEINMIDGQALDPTSFGETNNYGVWIPKAYEGTYGTNGFYITGADSADLGADESGNGNDFTSTGLTAADQVSDSPTLNSPVISPIDYQTGSNVTISDGNLTFENANSGSANDARATFAISSGKWYWEVEADALGQSGVGREFIGVVSPEWRLGTGSAGSNFSQDSTGYAYNTVGQKINNNSASSYGSALSAGDIVGVALDLDNGKIWWSVNGTFQASGDPAAGTNEAYSGLSGTFAPAFAVDYGTGTSRLIANFGQTGGLTYTPPTGFLQIDSSTLPTQTIKDGSAYFQASLYTGNGTAIGSGGKSVTQDKNSTFQPDFVWIKERNGAADNSLYDAVRGTTKDLASNDSSSETTETEGLTAFDAAGFTVGSLAKVNTSSDTYVAWQWLAANGTASNSDGNITSTVSVNTTAGFSIVTYTGDGNDNATVGHGLGVTPETVWLLPRSNGDNKQVSNWETGVTAFTEDLKLNAAEVAASSSNRVKGGSSTTFTLGTDVNINGSGRTYVAYVWNEVAGFSKFATYTSNGSTDGPFVYCGFRPAVVFIRCTENGENWHMYDTTRNTYNATNLFLYPTTSDSEQSSGRDIDILSNGFKLRGTDGGINSATNRKYVAMCFAEHPFGGSDVAPATAR